MQGKFERYFLFVEIDIASIDIATHMFSRAGVGRPTCQPFAAAFDRICPHWMIWSPGYRRNWRALAVI